MNVPEVGMSAMRWLLSLANRRKRGSPDFEDIYDHLTYHQSLIHRSLHASHKHAKKLFRKHKLTFHNLKAASSKAAAGATLAGTLFVAPVHSETAKNHRADAATHAQAQIPAPSSTGPLAGPQNPNPEKLTQSQFGDKIKEIMQGSSRDGKLSEAQFAQIEQLLHAQLGVTVSTKTDSGFELNKHYGYSGREQHLPTRPGDKAANHVNPDDPTAIASGVTPGRGAWGYVAPDEEKWYVVGQTFLSDQFGSQSTKDLGGQRYIVIKIPEDANGNYTMVARGALWDAGPGRSTGKVFGASPEFFHQVGDAAAGQAKFKAIMLPEVGDRKPASELGPLNHNFRQP